MRFSYSIGELIGTTSQELMQVNVEALRSGAQQDNPIQPIVEKKIWNELNDIGG